MKILVTGATGFIGRHLIKSLVNTNEIHIIVRKESHIPFETEKINIFYYDGSIEKLITYFKQEKFDGVIHLASLFLATHSTEEIAGLIGSNVQFATELLEACKISGVKWFINTGTFWQNYQNEEYNPVNLYAATKEAFEVIAKYYTQTSNLIFTTIKLNDTFGPNDTRNKVFNLWAKIAESGELLEMSAGEQMIDISYIDDVVSAYELLINHLGSDNAKKFKEKFFIVSSNERISLRELAILYEEATATKLNIKWGAKPYREREVMIPWNKGEMVPEWKQKYSLKEAIIKTVQKELK